MQFVYDDISMKNKLAVCQLSWTVDVPSFDKKSLFNTVLEFALYWDYKPNKDYVCQKVTITSTKFKNHLYYDSFDSFLVNGPWELLLFGSFLDEPLGYKDSREHETIPYGKTNKTVLNSLTLYLEGSSVGRLQER